MCFFLTKIEKLINTHIMFRKFFNRKSQLNREAVFEQLKIDEGVANEIYKDHLGYPTFGVGHLVLESIQNTGKKSEHQSQKKESKSVLKKTSTQQSENVSYYTKTGSLETYRRSPNKYWLT